jgi:hypothetical protein
MKVIYLILMSSLLLTACGGGEEPPAPEQPVPEPEQPVTEPEQPVVDDTAPVITLIGANPIKLVQGAAYIELEANAEDETDGDITESIDIDESKINTQVVGIYQVTYTVSDAAGNETIIRRIVEVTAAAIIDTRAPVITLIGPNPIQLVQGATYIELSATVEDETDGDITNNIDIDASSINNQVAGSYQVTYTVSDAAGNQAIISRIVEVFKTTTAFTELSDVSVGTADFTHIAIDSQDNAYVIFQDKFQENFTRIRKQINGTWQNLGNNDGILSTQSASYQQVAITSDDHIYAAFIENEEIKLKQLTPLAQEQPGTWQNINLPTIVGSIDSLQMALDSTDVPYLLYGQDGIHTLISYQNGQWQVVGCESFNVGVIASSYIIDFVPYSASSIVLTYRNNTDTNKAVRTIIFDGSNWQEKSGLGSGSSTALTVSSTGDFYAFKVLFSDKFGAVSVYKLIAEQWTIIDEFGFNHELTEHGINEAGIPIYSDIVINEQNELYVAFTVPQTLATTTEKITIVAKYNDFNWQQLIGSDTTPVLQATTSINMVVTSENTILITFIDGSTNRYGEAVMLKELAL